MGQARKITVEIDEKLLKRAQKQSGEGVTATVRQGLELLAASEAFERIRRMRGRVEFSISSKEMRADRE